jgi:hypothetical protein
MNKLTVPASKKALRLPPSSGPRALRPAAPGWKRYCGWCAVSTAVGTDGRDVLCTRCGH